MQHQLRRGGGWRTEEMPGDEAEKQTGLDSLVPGPFYFSVRI
jgi:hypothetical protein